MTSKVLIKDHQCPVCWELLLEPVTMPCDDKHCVCMPCHKNNVQLSSLCCPLCRTRISNWDRQANRDHTLIDQERWDLIQKHFPEEVQRRKAGLDTSLYTNFVPEVHMTISKPGEIRKEYEEEVKRLTEQTEEERRKEEEASKAEIIRLRLEETTRKKIEKNDSFICQQISDMHDSIDIATAITNTRTSTEQDTRIYSKYEEILKSKPRTNDANSNPDDIFGYEPGDKPQKDSIMYDKNDIQQFDRVVREQTTPIQTTTTTSPPLPTRTVVIDRETPPDVNKQEQPNETCEFSLEFGSGLFIKPRLPSKEPGHSASQEVETRDNQIDTLSVEPHNSASQSNSLGGWRISSNSLTEDTTAKFRPIEKAPVTPPRKSSKGLPLQTHLIRVNAQKVIVPQQKQQNVTVRRRPVSPLIPYDHGLTKEEMNGTCIIERPKEKLMDETTSNGFQTPPRAAALIMPSSPPLSVSSPVRSSGNRVFRMKTDKKPLHRPVVRKEKERKVVKLVKEKTERRNDERASLISAEQLSVRKRNASETDSSVLVTPRKVQQRCRSTDTSVGLLHHDDFISPFQRIAGGGDVSNNVTILTDNRRIRKPRNRYSPEIEVKKRRCLPVKYDTLSTIGIELPESSIANQVKEINDDDMGIIEPNEERNDDDLVIIQPIRALSTFVDHPLDATFGRSSAELVKVKVREVVTPRPEIVDGNERATESRKEKIEAPRNQGRPRKQAEATESGKETDEALEVTRKRGRPRKQAEATESGKETVEAPEVTRKRGRPRKQAETTESGTETVEALEAPRTQGRPRKQPEATESGKETDEALEAPRTQGRPRKQPETNESGTETVEAPEVTRKRGRPRKQPEATESGKEKIEAPLKQGRPQKQAEPSESGKETVEAPEVTRKRGRPRKQPEATESGKETDEALEAPRKQGRPRKQPEAAESGKETVEAPEATQKRGKLQKLVEATESRKEADEATESRKETVEAPEATQKRGKLQKLVEATESRKEADEATESRKETVEAPEATQKRGKLQKRVEATESRKEADEATESLNEIIEVPEAVESVKEKIEAHRKRGKLRKHVEPPESETGTVEAPEVPRKRGSRRRQLETTEPVKVKIEAPETTESIKETIEIPESPQKRGKLGKPVNSGKETVETPEATQKRGNLRKKPEASEARKETDEAPEKRESRRKQPEATEVRKETAEAPAEAPRKRESRRKQTEAPSRKETDEAPAEAPQKRESRRKQIEPPKSGKETIEVPEASSESMQFPNAKIAVRKSARKTGTSAKYSDPVEIGAKQIEASPNARKKKPSMAVVHEVDTSAEDRDLQLAKTLQEKFNFEAKYRVVDRRKNSGDAYTLRKK